MSQKFYVGDIVQLRKGHPCGSDQWEVMRTGMDFRMKCLGCGHVVMLPLSAFEGRETYRVTDNRAGQLESTPT